MQCLSPEDNQVIVPDWMLNSMCIPEATECVVRTTVLDKISGITLQPCTSDFNDKDVERQTGKKQSKVFMDECTIESELQRIGT